MNRSIVFLFCCSLSASLSVADQWKDITGKHTIDADFVALIGETLVLKTDASRVMTIPMEKLDEPSRNLATTFATQIAAMTGTGSVSASSNLNRADKVNGLLLDWTGSELNGNLKETLQQKLSKMLFVDVETLQGEMISTVFDGTLMKISLGKKSSNASQKMPLFAAPLGVQENDVVEFEDLSTSVECPKIASFVRSDFLLKDDAAAKVFEQALDQVWKVSTFDKEHKRIKHEGNEWTFVRGDFFKEFKGFIVTTDESGKVVNVAYSLSIQD